MGLAGKDIRAPRGQVWVCESIQEADPGWPGVGKARTCWESPGGGVWLLLGVALTGRGKHTAPGRCCGLAADCSVPCRSQHPRTCGKGETLRSLAPGSHCSQPLEPGPWPGNPGVPVQGLEQGGHSCALGICHLLQDHHITVGHNLEMIN